jgi:hypothetical protein
MDNLQAESQYAAKILDTLAMTPSTMPSTRIDEDKTRNAAACMTAFVCARLASQGAQPESIQQTTFQWSNGLFNVRNTVKDHLWTNLRPTFTEHFRELSTDKPSAYIMLAWPPNEDTFHVWVIPGGIVHTALPQIPYGKVKDKQTLRILPGKNVFERCEGSPDLSIFYRSVTWSKGEKAKLIEAVKIDEAARSRNRGESDDSSIETDPDELQASDTPGFTTATVEYVLQLPAHATDGAWHTKTKERYQAVLRGPCNALVEMLRTGYIERLSPEVAGGTRHLSILKKNDYGKGGYHDHYWFGFYDPAAGSKTKSVQLFFHLLGLKKKWGYGFSMGNYCAEYIERLLTAISDDRQSVADYAEKAPADTLVRVMTGFDEKGFSPVEFAESIRNEKDAANFGLEGVITRIDVLREYDLETLPEHDDSVVEEVGSYFIWAWPFFQASMTGTWPKASEISTTRVDDVNLDEDVDEDAATSLMELSTATALPVSFLEQMEEALLTKQQAVLVGPPGTSKTYISKQFARYFVRQRPGRAQGRFQELYMHANWSYEDFFEGLKPTASKDGHLTFEPQKGFFLEWVEQLKDFDSSARHVLVLDEINRCDTAAVLGELLQLLEYRGTTIRLLSGRRFVFPRNLFILGTMNSADRSVGRMDLALRRRFLWLDLYPDAAALATWLARPGNNPVQFDATSLTECNAILSRRGIPKEQHIGHALFMTQASESNEISSIGQDVPLTERHLCRIVRFSVLPYVKELFVTQFGQVDDGVMLAIERQLLSCLTAPDSESQIKD